MKTSPSPNQGFPAIHADMLVAYVKVAERLSVSGAADELDLGKSQVSKRIAQLEQQLGATLFSRSTRKVALTPAGETYLEHARRALAELTAGQERLRALRSELTGSIRITAPVSWGQRVLAPRLPEFLRLHPALDIELSLSDQVMDLARERMDVALRWSATARQDLQASPVARIDWLLAASPTYLQQAGIPQHPQELSQHACFSYWREQSDDIWQLASTALSLEAGQRDIQRIQVRGRYHVNNPEAVLEAAIQGLGIALLPDYLCGPAVQQGTLATVLPDWAPITKFGTHISAVVAPERLLLPRNRVLLAFLKDRLMG